MTGGLVKCGNDVSGGFGVGRLPARRCEIRVPRQAVASREPVVGRRFLGSCEPIDRGREVRTVVRGDGMSSVPFYPSLAHGDGTEQGSGPQAPNPAGESPKNRRARGRRAERRRGGTHGHVGDPVSQLARRWTRPWSARGVHERPRHWAIAPPNPRLNRYSPWAGSLGSAAP